MALRAAQLLALATAVQAADVPESDWCSWVPVKARQFVTDCNYTAESPISTTKGCEAWCEWVPGPSWKSNSNCFKCSASSADALETIGEPIPESPRPGLKVKVATSFPRWCRWVPYGSLPFVPDCRGYGGGGAEYTPQPICAPWCVWVPAASWVYTPACRGCYGEEPRPVGGGGRPVDPVCRNWCRWVPRPSWQYTPACRGCGSEGAGTGGAGGGSGGPPEGGVCADWCQYVPDSSLQYNPDCRDCNRGVNGNRPNGTQGPPVNRPPRPTGTPCAHYCKWVPGASWQYTPACRGCSYARAAPTATPAAKANATEPEAGTPEGPFNGGCADWCQNVPRTAWESASGCAGCF